DVRSMFQQGNRLWLATTTGVLRVTLDEAQPLATAFVTQVERYGEERGLPRGYSYVVGAIDGQPRFATGRGIQLYDAAKGEFAPDARFARLFEEKSRRVLQFEQDVQGRVWMRTMDESGTVREIGAAVPQANGRYRWDASSLNAIAGEVIDRIYADVDGVVWFGGEDAVYRYDSRAAAGGGASFDALVREVSTRAGKLVFGGAGAAAAPVFDYSQNALRFEFAAPGADFRPTRFQVYLEGADAGWIPWSTQAHREYTNLREGAYRLHVRAMSASGVVSRAQPYEFHVLPPWYRTRLAYAAYVILLAALVALVSRWRSLALTQRNRELASLVSARTRELESANAALTELSVTDSVTGLKNRRHLIEQIEHDVGAVRRAYAERRLDPLGAQDANIDLLFVLVDIDHFKQVNDHYGHAAGDRVLQQFARILQSVSRETDTAVRWGGEEFLLLARFANGDSGPLIAERIRALTASHVFVLPEGKTLRRTCSIGFASFPLCLAAPEQFAWEDAVELADQCLYKSKHSGRNTWMGVCGTQQAPTRDWAFERLADLDTLVADGVLRVLRPPVQVERSDTAA
ncbi:MAG: diguanylate cyclase, partial [Steroidobacteraceae bacterium]